jgi:hypothetical protein
MDSKKRRVSSRVAGGSNSARAGGGLPDVSERDGASTNLFCTDGRSRFEAEAIPLLTSVEVGVKGCSSGQHICLPSWGSVAGIRADRPLHPTFMGESSIAAG